MFANYVLTTPTVSNTWSEVFCGLPHWRKTQDTLAYFEPITNNTAINIITKIKQLKNFENRILLTSMPLQT